VTVKSTLDSAHCHQCGRKISKCIGHDRAITLRHLSILGHAVYLRLRPKRFQCPYCANKPTSTQQLAWYQPNSPHTKAYDQHLL
jgi:transposase